MRGAQRFTTAVVSLGCLLFSLSAPSGAAFAQHWIPPRPGQDSCSGWDTAAAQQKCRDDEATQQRQRDAQDRADKEDWQRELAARDAKEKAFEQKQADEREAAVRGAAKQAQERAEAYTRRQLADAADPYKRVDVADLAFKPEKYRGRKLKVAGLQCYADPGDYRCTSADPSIDDIMPVRVASGALGPDNSRSNLEHVCGTIRMAVSSACRVTLRFVLDDYKIETDRDGRDVLVLMSDALILLDEP